MSCVNEHLEDLRRHRSAPTSSPNIALTSFCHYLKLVTMTYIMLRVNDITGDIC